MLGVKQFRKIRKNSRNLRKFDAHNFLFYSINLGYDQIFSKIYSQLGRCQTGAVLRESTGPMPDIWRVLCRSTVPWTETAQVDPRNTGQDWYRPSWPITFSKGTTINDLGGPGGNREKKNLGGPSPGKKRHSHGKNKSIFDFSSGPAPRSLMVDP